VSVVKTIRERIKAIYPRGQEAASMDSRPEEAGTETEPEGTESSAQAEPENQRPVIDEDISGSVNAALPDADEE
jgi:hypothetical protein